MDSSDSDDTVVMTSPKGETYHEQDVQHLFRAIRKGKGHLTRFMLAASNNALLNCWDKEGKTPLIECCYIKEESTRDHMVRILKEAGADVNMKDRNGRTALIHACEQRCNDIVRILVQHCNINPDIDDTEGNSALIHSANIGNDVALELLVRNFRRLGLQVDHYNKAGYTALHVASRNGYLQCAKILAIKGKASLTVKDKVHQLTPLEWCLKQGYQKPEVEFLKPSAKFYRLAKLTTTMAKYRKKSTQESLLSVHGSPKTSPPRERDKSKGTTKGFLKKTKTQSADESSEQATKSKGSDLSILDKISSSIKADSHSSHKKIGAKGNKQRSFSASDQPGEVVPSDQASKAALSHSYSHPMGHPTSKGENTHGRLEGHMSLSDEFGECDTDEPLSSDTESSLVKFGLSGDFDTSRESSSLYAEGGVYCGSTPSGGEDTPRHSESLSPYYADGGVYCGYTPSSSGASDSLDPRRHMYKDGTPYCGASTPSYSESTPSLAPSGSEVDGECLSEEDDEASDTDSDDVTFSTLADKGVDCKDFIRKEALKAKPNPAQSKTTPTTPSTTTPTAQSKTTHTVPSMTRPTTPSTTTPTAQSKTTPTVQSMTTPTIQSKTTPATQSKTTPTSSSTTTPTIQSKTTPSASAKRSGNRPSQRVDRADSASPPTETECLDNVVPWATLHESSEPECVSSTPIANVLKQPSHALPRKDEPSPKIQQISHQPAKSPGAGREIVSPLTEIEYLDMNDSNNSHTLAIDAKRNQTVSAVMRSAQTSRFSQQAARDNVCESPVTEIEYIDDTPGPEAPLELPRVAEAAPRQTKVNKLSGNASRSTDIRPHGRTSASPKTEIEYIDLTTPEGSRSATPLDVVVSDSETSPDYQSRVRRSVHSLSGNTTMVVDQATSAGFGVDDSCQSIAGDRKGRGVHSDTVTVSRDNGGAVDDGSDHINGGNPGGKETTAVKHLNHCVINSQGHNDHAKADGTNNRQGHDDNAKADGTNICLDDNNTLDVGKCLSSNELNQTHAIIP